MEQIYTAACPTTHFLTNDFHLLGYINSPRESSYKCEVEWWWELAYWSYIWLVLINIPAAIFLRVPMYYSWGLTLSLQIVALAPIMRSYLPSCLTFFLRDLMITHGRMMWVRNWWWSLYNVVDVTYNPLTYRLERHLFYYNSIIYNCLDIICYWALCFALIGVFLLMRVCFVPFHYWSGHFADLERDYRY